MARKTGAAWPAFYRRSGAAGYHVRLPSMEDVEKVVIDEVVIAGQSKPFSDLRQTGRRLPGVDNVACR